MKAFLVLCMLALVGCGADDRRQADPSGVQAAKADQAKRVQVTQTQLDAQFKNGADPVEIDGMASYTNCEVVPGTKVLDGTTWVPVYMCDPIGSQTEE